MSETVLPTIVARDKVGRDKVSDDKVSGSPLRIVIERSVQASKMPSGGPPSPGGDGPKGSKGEEPRKAPQTIVWVLPSLHYGAALSTLPRAVITDGNTTATPVYTPPLDATVPGVGQHPMSVFVAGNDQYLPATVPVTLQVLKKSLVVTVEPAQMAAGTKPPALKFKAEGLVPPDAVSVVFNNAPTDKSEPKLDGYEVTPVVTFTSGSVLNYDLEVKSAQVVVTKSFSNMDAEITRLRHAIVALKDDVLLKRLDDIEKRRDKRETEPAALAKELATVDQELYDATYVPVTAVTVAAIGAAKIEKDQGPRLQAKIVPPNATVQGVDWVPDDSGMVVVSDDGQVTRAPGSVDGGNAIVRAISKSREKVPGPITIEVVAKPVDIDIEAPDHIFLGTRALQLKATVVPPEAPQAVTWSIDGAYNKANISITREGLLSVEKPTSKGGTAKGRLGLKATSTADPTVFSILPVPFGGVAATGITIPPPDKSAKIEPGSQVKLEASVEPSEAAQKVTWSLDSEGVATIASQTDTTITLAIAKPGEIEVTATATDGTGVTRMRRFGVKVPVTGLTIESPKTTIDIGETVTLVAKFQPDGAREAVEWTPSDASVVRIDAKGKVNPRKAGETTVTATIPGTKFSAPVKLKVQVTATSTLSHEQFDVMRPLIDKYATSIGIVGNPTAAVQYAKYLSSLQKDLFDGGRPPNPGAGDAKIPIDLGTVRTELIALRDKYYSLEHRDWLKKAKFSEKNNCLLRDEGKITVKTSRDDGEPDDEWTFDGHVTMFDTGEQLPVGSDPQALIRKVYRVNAKGYAGLHVTAYVYPTNKDQQIKGYISGWDWKPSPGSNIQTWWHDLGLPFFKVQAALEDWLDDNMEPANKALTDCYDDIRKNDGKTIAEA
jgi:hypothetical protein